MSRMSRCKDCDAEILWCRTRKGKKMPLDAEPAEGDFDLGGGEPPLAIYKGKGNGTHTCHFVTCPDAKGRKSDPNPNRSTQECPKCKHRFVGK